MLPKSNQFNNSGETANELLDLNLESVIWNESKVFVPKIKGGQTIWTAESINLDTKMVGIYAPGLLFKPEFEMMLEDFVLMMRNTHDPKFNVVIKTSITIDACKMNLVDKESNDATEPHEQEVVPNIYRRECWFESPIEIDLAKCIHVFQHTCKGRLENCSGNIRTEENGKEYVNQLRIFNFEIEKGYGAEPVQPDQIKRLLQQQQQNNSRNNEPTMVSSKMIKETILQNGRKNEMKIEMVNQSSVSK